MTAGPGRIDQRAPSECVLIVDDDGGIRGVLSEILQDEGHLVESAGNGQEALRKLESSTRPCLILLDLMMPVMNGWEFMSRRTELDGLANIPVVVISADANVGEKASSIGASDYLQKPIDLDRLLDTVARYCS